MTPSILFLVFLAALFLSHGMSYAFHHLSDEERRLGHASILAGVVCLAGAMFTFMLLKNS